MIVKDFAQVCFVGVLAQLIAFACASAAWREGFLDDDRLHLVGEGRAEGDLPEIQRIAMAREAALMDAMSHWPRYCTVLNNDEGIAKFRVENQKQRLVECSGNACRARIVIERSKLRQRCQSG